VPGKLLKQGNDQSSPEAEWRKIRSAKVTLPHILRARLRAPANGAAFWRAPDIYFRLIREYGDRFVRLGEIATIKRGITSGCDAFFMPHDVTDEILARLAEGLPWNDVGLMTQCTLTEVQTGKVRIVRAGDKTLAPH